MSKMKLEWKKGDWAAYFGLMTNNLTNLLTMMGLLIFVVGIPKEIVYGRIAPAFGMAVLAASLCYAWFGLQLAKKTGRSDVTALPSGPSAPSIFTVSFMVLMPVYQQTGDFEFALQIGLVWCFVEAMILVGGSFLGDAIRQMIPHRAALLPVRSRPAVAGDEPDAASIRGADRLLRRAAADLHQLVWQEAHLRPYPDRPAVADCRYCAGLGFRSANPGGDQGVDVILWLQPATSAYR